MAGGMHFYGHTQHFAVAHLKCRAMTNNKSVIYKLQPDFVAPKVQFKVPGLGTRENHSFCPARGVTFGPAAMQRELESVVQIVQQSGKVP
jgi:hypothetical protein